MLLREATDTRMRFLGAPAGYEFMSLVERSLLAGTDDSGLSPDSKALIAEHVTTPIEIKVFVTPTCPHCPRAVTLAHRMAVESPNISATCVEATEFLDLSRQYRVTGVPKTVSSVGAEILGALPEEEFVRGILDGQTIRPYALKAFLFERLPAGCPGLAFEGLAFQDVGRSIRLRDHAERLASLALGIPGGHAVTHPLLEGPDHPVAVVPALRISVCSAAPRAS